MMFKKIKSAYEYIKEEIDDRLVDFDLPVFLLNVGFICFVILMVSACSVVLYDDFKNYDKYERQRQCCNECKKQ